MDLKTALDFPFEIIAQILDHATELRVTRISHEKKFIVSPLVLCRVSKSWQSYLHSKPPVWSNVIIHMRGAQQRPVIYEKGLREWLQRAGKHPLTIYISGGGVRGIDRSWAVDILKLLASFQDQWRKVEFHYVDIGVVYRLLRTLNGFPLLRSLVFYGIHVNFLFPDLKFFPALQDVGIIGYRGHYHGQMANATHITDLSLSCMDSVESCRIFLWFPNLVRADFQSLTADVRKCTHSHTTKIMHPHIRFLQIAVRIWLDASAILSYLAAPNLEDFRLTINRTPPSYAITKLEGLLCTSQCNLAVLVLQFTLTNETHLVHILSLLPSLRELHVTPDLSVGGISCQDFGGAFFDALHPHMNPTYLPNLRVLTYEGDLSVGVNFFNILVLRFQVESRSPMVGLELQSVDDQSGTYQTSPSPAKLLFAKIKSDQKEHSLDRHGLQDLSSRVKSLIERNALWLINRTGGSTWRGFG